MEQATWIQFRFGTPLYFNHDVDGIDMKLIKKHLLLKVRIFGIRET